MTPKPPSCWTCHSYDRSCRKCTIGKTNPPKKHLAQTIAEQFGPQALCMKSPFREPLIMRMRYPHGRQTALPVSNRYKIEVELLDE